MKIIQGDVITYELLSTSVQDKSNNLMLCFQSCLKVYQLLSLRTPRGSQRLITVAIKTTMNLRCFTKWLLLKSVDVSRKEHKTFLKLIDQ